MLICLATGTFASAFPRRCQAQDLRVLLGYVSTVFCPSQVAPKATVAAQDTTSLVYRHTSSQRSRHQWRKSPQCAHKFASAHALWVCFNMATRPLHLRGVAGASLRYPLQTASVSYTSCFHVCIGAFMTLRRVASSPLRGLVTLVPTGRTTVAFCLGLCQWSSLAFVMVATLPESGISTKYYAASHCAVWFILVSTCPAMGSIGLSLTVTLATANRASSYAPAAHQSQTNIRAASRTPETSKWELPDTLKQLTHSRQPLW